MTSRINVSAPGKVIISGEHVVVHGYPALVAAIDKRITLSLRQTASPLRVFPLESKTFVKDALEILKRYIKFSLMGIKIEINSEIPIGRGMGSSAAFAVALSKALLTHIGKSGNLKKVSDLAYELEKKYHGNPSGVDISISTYGGVLWFRKETEEFKIFSKVRLNNKLANLYLLDSGKPDETTKETVAHVSQLLKAKPGQTQETFKEIEAITRAILQYITGEKSYNFIDLIRTNERLLEKLGVVSPYTITLIRKIEKVGGAAKMSGGGGIKGNSGVLLVYHPDPEKLLSLIGQTRFNMEKVVIGAKGVQVETTS